MDYFFNEELIVPFEQMKRWTKKMYLACGMRDSDAEIVADSLVTADARGVYSHGCMRNTIYINRLLCGANSPDARPEVIRDRPAFALMDGHNAMGQVASYHAMQLAVEKAKKYGTASVSVRGSNHQGACAYIAELALKEDMIGFSWTLNGTNIMAPWGGVERQLGNNPFSVAIPCLTKPPVVLDMAQSVVARGKVVMAMKTHSPIPLTWALDTKGRPTADAEAGYWGTVRPWGDYKGYGLTYVIAALTAILPNAAFGADVNDFYEDFSVQNTGHLVSAINIAALTDVEEFKRRMDESVDYLKSGKKAEGVEEIFVPGEIEANNLKRQLRDGIVYPMEVIEENRALAKKLGVEVMV